MTDEDTPAWAKSLGWCQNCNKDGIERTEQVYSPNRNHWLCLRCGAEVVTPERHEEIKEAVKNLTVEDIYGRRVH